MQPQADYFHNCLEGEDHGEENVENLQDVGDNICLLVVFNSHGNHVEHDSDDNA